MKSRALRVALVSASLSLLAGVAHAQTAREDSVNYRPRPDFDPEGLYIDDIFDAVGRVVGAIPRDRKRDPSGSGVLVMPRLQLGSYYDTNVLRTPNNHRSDVVQTARASLDITSD